VEIGIPAIVTPIGVVVVGVLLWWRMGRVEKELDRLQVARDELAERLGQIGVTVNLLREWTGELWRSAGARGAVSPSPLPPPPAPGGEEWSGAERRSGTERRRRAPGPSGWRAEED